MVRSELVQKLVEKKPHLTPRQAEAIVVRIFGEIAGALARGDRVELRGFGNFSTRERPAHIGRNPHSGAAVEVATKRFTHFKPSRRMIVLLSSG